MKTEITKIDTVTAERWLALNQSNRKLNAHYVAKLAGSMRRGEWQLNGESIKFSADPVILLDGQHRLAAVIRSETPIESVVIWDLERPAQATMDTGKKRGLANVLQLQGEHDVANLASAVTTYFRLQAGGLRGGMEGWPTPTQALETLAANPDLRRWLPQVHRLRRVVPGTPVGMFAALFYRLSQIDTDDAMFFCAYLISGAELKERDPVFVLRRTLTAQVGNRKLRGEVKVALAIKAWNAFRDGREISLLGWRPGGATREPFPEPR